MDTLTGKNPMSVYIKSIVKSWGWFIVLCAVAGCLAGVWFCRYDDWVYSYRVSVWIAGWRCSNPEVDISGQEHAARISDVCTNSACAVDDFQSLLQDKKFQKLLRAQLAGQASEQEIRRMDLAAEHLNNSCLIEISASGANPVKAWFFLSKVMQVLNVNSRQLFNVNFMILPHSAGPGMAEKVYNLSRMALIVGVGSAAGLLIGCLAGLIFWYCGRENCTIGEFAAQVGVPLLAVLPEYRTAADEQYANVYNAAVDDLQTCLEAFLPISGRGQVIVIAGVVSRQGVEKLISEFACCLSRSGKKVLLVDLDWRRNAPLSFFGYDNSSGILELLSSTRDFAELVIRAQDNSRPDLLACGGCADPGRFRFNSRMVEEFLRQMVNEYDYILLAPAPMNSSAEPMIFARLADLSILAGGIGLSDLTKTKLVLWRLHKATAHVGGFVAVDMPIRSLPELYESRSSFVYQYYINRS